MSLQMGSVQSQRRLKEVTGRALTQDGWHASEKGSGYKHTQNKDHVKTQKDDGHSQAKRRGLQKRP